MSSIITTEIPKPLLDLTEKYLYRKYQIIVTSTEQCQILSVENENEMLKSFLEIVTMKLTNPKTIKLPLSGNSDIFIRNGDWGTLSLIYKFYLLQTCSDNSYQVFIISHPNSNEYILQCFLELKLGHIVEEKISIVCLSFSELKLNLLQNLTIGEKDFYNTLAGWLNCRLKTKDITYNHIANGLSIHNSNEVSEDHPLYLKDGERYILYTDRYFPSIRGILKSEYVSVDLSKIRLTENMTRHCTSEECEKLSWFGIYVCSGVDL